MKKNNRVYGVIGIGAYMSMWNADMNGGPKTTINDEMYATDKALKYSIKNLWRCQGENILYFKHRDINYELLNLAQIYTQKFNEALPKDKDKDKYTKVLNNIFKCIDVRNFGATFAVDKINLGLTGVVQICQGMNKWYDSNVVTADIMSPFVNSKKEEASMTSLGTKNMVDEAHYFYSLTVNPYNTEDLIGIIDGYEGYTEEDYKKLKQSLLCCATALDTNAKVGCENEFSLFVNCKNNSELNLSNLHSYISMDENRTIDVTNLIDYLTPNMNEIDTIEIFYNNKKLSLKYDKNDKIIVKNMYGEIIE